MSHCIFSPLIRNREEEEEEYEEEDEEEEAEETTTQDAEYGTACMMIMIMLHVE